MNVKATAGLGAALALWAGSAVGGDMDWRATSAPPAVERAREVIARTRPLGESSGVTLGKPVPVTDAPAPAEPDLVDRAVTPASFDPGPQKITVRAQAPDTVAPPGGGAVPPPSVGNEAFNNGALAGPTVDRGGWGDRFWGGCKDVFTRRCGGAFRSDIEGDLCEFASPVSNPFLAEDPRALTEVKPIFIYQSIPDDSPFFGGGSTEFFGVQARLALTERLSLVMNKLGGVFIQPEGFEDQSGFAEVWVGPKYTFYRDVDNKALAAAGVTFQIPTGSREVFQDTDGVTVAPYLSFAKGFGRLPNGYGNFNFMSTTGVAFNGGDRSDYFFSQLHLDFDVAGQRRFYPLIELNWIRYIGNGNARPINFEGGDLFNLGARDVKGQSVVTLATGLRYKFSEGLQFGGAVEFPLTNEKALNDFRVTLDFIFRY